MNEQEKKEWLAEWSREKLDDLIFKHATIGVDKATDGARAVSAVISHADELIVKQVQENHPVSKEHVMIDRTLNIDANNVGIGNVKIKWEVGKAYRTRDGRRAVMREQKHNIIKLILMNENESYVLFTVDCLSGRSSSSLSCDLDIIGPWEEEPIKAQFATWDPDGAIKARYEDPFFGICARCNSAQLTLTSDDRYICAECTYRLVDFSCASYCMIAENQKNVRKPVPAKPEQKAKPSDYAGAHMRDLNTPDNRRPRVSLRTAAQIAHERAVLRLRQHKLARWGRAEHVRWEEEP